MVLNINKKKLKYVSGFLFLKKKKQKATYWVCSDSGTDHFSPVCLSRLEYSYSPNKKDSTDILLTTHITSVSKPTHIPALIINSKMQQSLSQKQLLTNILCVNLDSSMKRLIVLSQL